MLDIVGELASGTSLGRQIGCKNCFKFPGKDLSNLWCNRYIQFPLSRIAAMNLYKYAASGFPQRRLYEIPIPIQLWQELSK